MGPSPIPASQWGSSRKGWLKRRILDSSSSVIIFFRFDTIITHIFFTTRWFVDLRNVARLHLSCSYLTIAVDVRDADSVTKMVKWYSESTSHFVLMPLLPSLTWFLLHRNMAVSTSLINLAQSGGLLCSEDTPLRRFQLMQRVNLERLRHNPSDLSPLQSQRMEGPNVSPQINSGARLRMP